jgi:hypothetical protein
MSELSTLSNSFPKLISTDPCGEDLFEGRSQQRTADIIASHIENSTFKLIGIDGSWGSGKSNVIWIIRNKLIQTHHMFIYDAWSHQEDLQRRSFLEELTDNLQKSEIVDPEEWDKRLKDLLSRKRTVKTKQVPQLSRGLIISFAVVLLMPIAKVLSEVVPIEHWPWRLLISISPVAAAGVYFYRLIKKKKEEWDWRKIFYLYKDKELETELNENISEKEPSVREFRNWMEDLSKAIKIKKDKKLVLVFDNIDRLPSNKVQALWSSIHTFFSDWAYEDIAVIVPFDRIHIQDSFVLNENTEKDAEIASHFINKTFPVVFGISPAVLTDWQAFFQLKFDEAFGECGKEGFNDVITIFNLYHDRITPRGIIAFINDLVGLKMIWKEEIELRYIALYVATRKEILVDPLKNLLANTYADKADIIFRGDEAVSDKIAALVYNVSIEKASQVAMNREIELTLRQRNVEKIKNLWKHKDFVIILDKVINSKLIQVPDAVFTLDKLEESLTHEDCMRLKDTWSHLLSMGLGLPNSEKVFSDTQRALLKRAAIIGKQTQYLNFLCNEFKDTISLDGREYFIALDAIETCIKENNLSTNLLDFVRLKTVSPEIFLAHITEAKDKFTRYKLSTEQGKLDELLLSRFPDSLATIPVVPYFKNKYALPKLLAAIKKYITDGNPTVDNFLVLQSLLKVINPVSTPLDAMLPDANLHALLTTAPKDSELYYSLATMRFAKGAAYADPGGASAILIENFSGTIVQEVLKRIDQYKYAGDMILDGLKWNNTAGKELIKAMLANPSVSGARLSIATIFPKFYEITRLYELEPSVLFYYMNGWYTRVKDYCKSDTLQAVIPDIRFYQDLFKMDIPLKTEVANVAVKFVKDMPETDWKGLLLNKESYTFQLLVLLFHHNLLESLPDSVTPGLKEAFKDLVILNESPIYQMTGEFRMFYEKADPGLMINTGENTRDALINLGNTSIEKFLFFEWLLRIHGKLGKRSHDVVRTILVPVIQDQRSITLMLTESDYYIGLIASGTPNALEIIMELRKMVEAQSSYEALHLFEHHISERIYKGIEIEYATYYCPAEGAGDPRDVKHEMKRRVEQEGWTHFKVGKDIANDYEPLPGTANRLKYAFTYLGEREEKELDDQEWVSLP